MTTPCKEIAQDAPCSWCEQAAKAGGGFQTARAALTAELRKSGRKLPLQLKSGQQESEARQGRAGAKKSAGAGSSAADMFPDGQGAFNPSVAPRQGLLRSRGAKRPDAQGEALTCSCNLSEDLPHFVQHFQRQNYHAQEGFCPQAR